MNDQHEESNITYELHFIENTECLFVSEWKEYIAGDFYEALIDFFKMIKPLQEQTAPLYSDMQDFIIQFCEDSLGTLAEM